MRRLIIAVATVGISLATQAESHISPITLERKECYGTCPIYSVTIFSDGRVEYQGKPFVKEKGRHVDRVSVQELQKLTAEVDSAQFFSLDDEYSGITIGDIYTTATDLPTTIVTVVRGGKTKKVEDYMGAPKRLYELEQLIDRITRSCRWVGCNSSERYEDVPYYENFPVNRPVTFRGLLQRTWTGEYPDKLKFSGLDFRLMKNAVSLTVKAQKPGSLIKFAGYLIEARGVIEKSDTFKIDSVRAIRRLFDDKDLSASHQ